MKNCLSIKHNLDFFVSPNLNNSYLASRTDVSKNDMENGFCWYALPPTTIGDSIILFNLCYYRNKLMEIHASATGDKYGTSWDDWSEDKEKLCIKDTLTALQNEGYSEGIQAWGSIYGIYDTKAASGYVKIKLSS